MSTQQHRRTPFLAIPHFTPLCSTLLQNATIFITIWARKNPRRLAGVIRIFRRLVVIEPVIPTIFKERGAARGGISLW
jgi:hypothetical protein